MAGQLNAAGWSAALPASRQGRPAQQYSVARMYGVDAVFFGSVAMLMLQRSHSLHRSQLAVNARLANLLLHTQLPPSERALQAAGGAAPPL